MSQASSERPGSAVRVMIVEDDPETLARFGDAVSRDLRTRLVQRARDAREAIAALAHASPDVLLVDLGLPDLHGTEVIREAAKRIPQCDIMVITAFGDERSVLASIEAGATGYVLKDCSDAELVSRVLELRAGGAPMTPSIARLVLHRMRGASGSGEGRTQNEMLTPREMDVLRLLARGYSYVEIAEKLGIAANTVTSHVKNTYRKLAVHSGRAAVARAAQLGLLDRLDGERGPR